MTRVFPLALCLLGSVALAQNAPSPAPSAGVPAAPFTTLPPAPPPPPAPQAPRLPEPANRFMLTSPPAFGPISGVREGQTIATATIHAVKVARANGPINTAQLPRSLTRAFREIPANAPLQAVATKPGWYCGTIIERMLTNVVGCLIDENGDGQFEAATRAMFNAVTSTSLLITNRNNLLGVGFDEPTALTTPIAYQLLPAAEGPFANVRLTYRIARARDNRPPYIGFYWDGSDSSSGTKGLTANVGNILTTGEMLVTMPGLNIGARFDTDSQSITVRSLGTLPEVTQGFYFVGQRTVIIGY